MDKFELNMRHHGKHIDFYVTYWMIIVMNGCSIIMIIAPLVFASDRLRIIKLTKHFSIKSRNETLSDYPYV